MIIQGKIWLLGSNVSTDMIVPSRVLTTSDENELIAATLENEIPHFADRVSPGDFIVAGSNFGCGSSREEAVFVFKKLKLGGIIATSFARIFYRNAINLGFPVISVENPKQIGIQGEVIQVNLELATIQNIIQDKKFKFTPFPPFIQNFIKLGGAIEWLKSGK
jgi:3-isopropylmalate/(R)-2-methylmalate dehydratase small subunit